MIFKGTLNDCCTLAAQGIQQQLETNLKQRMLAMVMPEIEAVARETAKDITAKIESYHNMREGGIQLVVNFQQKVVHKVGP